MMKKILFVILFAITISTSSNVFSNETNTPFENTVAPFAVTFAATYLPLGLSTGLTSGDGCKYIPCKAVAQLVINDSQEYIQSGKLSVFLSHMINKVQDANTGLSEEEAIDVLVSDALKIL